MVDCVSVAYVIWFDLWWCQRIKSQRWMVEVVVVLRIFINVSIKCGSLRGTWVLLDKNVSLTLVSRLPLIVFNQEVVCGGMAAVWVRGTVGGRFWCTI